MQPSSDPFASTTGVERHTAIPRWGASRRTDTRRLMPVPARQCDPLTGLLTAAEFESQLAARFGALLGAPEAGALFLLDVDRFIRVNANFGFSTGDALLVALSDRLDRIAKLHNGLLCRGAQDEFALYVEHASKQKSLTLAAQLLEAVARPLRVGERKFFLTASIGISRYPGDAVGAAALLDRARQALNAARARGRGCYEALGSAAPQPIALEERALRRAIETDEVFLVYQPILDLQTRQVTAVEALVRWRHPEQGILVPGQFFPLANATGLIVDIGTWVLSRACAEIQVCHEMGFDDLSLCVNYSQAQLMPGNIASDIESILQHHGLARSQFRMEIFGADGSGFDADLYQRMQELKEIGIGLALDNFGAHAVSLSDLQRAPVDTLKIDRTVVDTASGSGGSGALRALTMLGRSFGLGVEAEGVETMEQLNLLHQEGCDQAQGYLLGRPVELPALRTLLCQAAQSVVAS
jgi:diguanylate cyclase